MGSNEQILEDSQHRAHQRRAIVASTVGTAIEWYDFFLYGIVSGLVFAKEFFPKSDPATGVLLSFSTFAVGFVARPIGAAIFGHYGDKIGRKASLVATMLLMGGATFAVALVPDYAKIGVWGAVLLTILRFIQGIGVGGEWGGSVLLALEWTQDSRHRGFVASWPQFGVPVGLVLANGAVLAASAMTRGSFLLWGWRIPFLLSLLLIVAGLYIRLGVVETPVFRRMQRENRIERAPLREVIKRQPREIVLTCLARVVENTSFYVFTVFILAYGTQFLNISHQLLLGAMLVAAALSLLWIPLFGWMSDRFGRKRIYLIGIGATAVFSFAYFAMLDSRQPALVFLSVALSLAPHNMMYGPQAAMIAESFTRRWRYSGASLGYQLTAIVAGGPAPIISAALLARYESGYAVALYILIGAAVSFAATLMLRDRSATDLSEEFEET